MAVIMLIYAITSGRPALAAIEFSSGEKCMAAREQLLTASKGTFYGQPIVLCAPK